MAVCRREGGVMGGKKCERRGVGGMEGGRSEGE